MYSIALKQKQHPTYILTDQASDTHVEVVSERGGIPILFPICGNLRFFMYGECDRVKNIPRCVLHFRE